MCVLPCFLLVISVYDEGWRKEMALATSFVPVEGLLECFLEWESVPGRGNNCPTVCPRHFQITLSM